MKINNLEFSAFTYCFSIVLILLALKWFCDVFQETHKYILFAIVNLASIFGIGAVFGGLSSAVLGNKYGR